ncbi:acrEF/envCD operon transcriptional regulator [Scandinavium goeteborgense]|uniref:acrEF/envCD operon transcriptional regulator n=1 Tax=Scandinavium goeteborgense TaxID=1851514 RepID=UPI000F68DAE9|nr:acrEF/envCD operon transcriptional regulator [Scandinavium goeteborgense]QKN80271.1 acrEF/envCD operon transcriptional regulator [Scandinavium goeteborgense]
MARKTKEDALITRQQLLDAAIEQFSLRGVSSTTLTDIADAAGVTRGAVYWHFNNKVELFNEMWREQIPLRDIIRDRVNINESDNPLMYLREMFVVGMQHIAQSVKLRALMQILYHKCEFTKEMMLESEIRQRICFGYEMPRRVLTQCVRNGSLPADTNIELALTMFHCFFSGVIKNWLLFPEHFNLYQQAPELVDNIMATLPHHPATLPMPMDNVAVYRHQAL